MDILQTLANFEQRKHGIYNNRDLSYQGQQKELAILEKSKQTFSAQAYLKLKADWEAVRAKAERLDKRKEQAEDEAAKQWDYNRLLYNARAVEAEIKNCFSLDEALKKHADAMRSNDKHLRRAWAENGLAAITAKWKETPATNDAKRQARAELEKLTTTAELEAIAKEADSITRQGVELYKVTDATARHFSEGVFSGGNEFYKLLDGVKVSEKVDVTTLATVQSIDFARG